MTLHEAIKKAQAETGGTVDSVIDCGDMWALSFAENRNAYNENGDELTHLLNMRIGSAHVLAYKENDRFEYCSAYNYILSTVDGKDVNFDKFVD